MFYRYWKNNIDSLHSPCKTKHGAFIIYKSFLDAERDNQLGSLLDRIILKDTKTLLHKISMVQLFEHADKVHFLTSQTGLRLFYRELRQKHMW